MLLAQISDPHLRTDRRATYGIVDTVTMFERCIAQLSALPRRPDAIVLTGDLAHAGEADEYGLLREIIDPLGIPYYAITGNHDDRDAMRRAFPDQPWLQDRRDAPGGYLQYAVDHGPLRIVGLDTLVPGRSGGALCGDRIAWLDRTLAAAPDRPTVVLMHHPPFATHISRFDRGRIAEASGLAPVIGRHPQVVRILCGHLHRPIQANYAGTLASTCPSPAHQTALDLDPDAASAFVMEPPAWQLHVWHDTAGLVSHTVMVGAFAGPYPFREPASLEDSLPSG